MNDAPRLFPRPELQEVGEYLKLHESEWRALGVGRVQVFGSVARGEAQEGSDVDVLVEFAAPAGLFAQVQLIRLFERLLGRRTDVVTEAALKRPLREAVLRDAVDVLALPTPQPTASVQTVPVQAEPAPRPWRWRVQELIQVQGRLADLIRGHDLASFGHDQAVQDAVCMNLLRLGEGTKFVPQEIQDAHPEIPWAELRSVRNLLAHDYFGIDVGLLWHTLTSELPPLKTRLEAVLTSTPELGTPELA